MNCDNHRSSAGNEYDDGSRWCVAALRRVEQANRKMSRVERLNDPNVIDAISGGIINLPRSESCSKNENGDCPDYEPRKLRRFLHLP